MTASDKVDLGELRVQDEAQLQSKCSKKQAKKEMRKEKLRNQRNTVAAVRSSGFDVCDTFGDVRLSNLKVKSGIDFWTAVGDLSSLLDGYHVILRTKVVKVRSKGSNIVFLVITENGSTTTAQCVCSEDKELIKYISKLTYNSAVDLEGFVVVPDRPVEGVTQKEVEVRLKRVFCVARADKLPFTLEDASRCEVDRGTGLLDDLGNDLKESKRVRVNTDTRLSYRVLDLQTPANQAIFKIMAEISAVFSEFMRAQGFLQIYPPELNDLGSSKGGARVFKLDYFGQNACLVQSSQLHKQLAVRAGFRRVYVVQEAFRAEDSDTNRHLTEFTGLHCEMEIEDSYSEVVDVCEALFLKFFDALHVKLSKDLEIVRAQFPSLPLKYLPKNPRLTFEEGVKMLQEAGLNIDCTKDLSTKAEKMLGKLVLEKYDSDFFILDRFPMAARPFYTMPCDTDPMFSNSFDVFIRGQEIVTGGERISSKDLFLQRAALSPEIDLKSLAT
ncbi:hypothetical protein AQUCO_00500359v1 [Aquilegia coerulea]|uniref:aspartate--tRNA ligase n=1 Tax=Aquilegia coerulea TaxID=218851 RepID=A0A2G5ERL4_AQUCA|nr:hypothetical protein AQUCO_00500359v1 [Aquilegia coerulea]